MTLKDRKKDIYPNNVTLCKANCEYNGVDLENKRVICSCNLNENKEGNATEDFLAEDNGNFFSYLLDNINYKIFKCYILWLSFSNLQYNIAFYTILGIIVIVIVLNLVFIFHTLPTLKGLIIKEIPTKESLRRDILEELKKIRQTSQNTLNNPNKKKLKKTSKTDEKVFEKIIDVDENEKNQKKKKRKMRAIMNKKISNPSIDKLITKTNSETEKEKEKEKEQETEKAELDNNNKEEEDFNELPYTEAVQKDKRNICSVFKSILFEKLELLSIFCVANKLKVMLILEYLLSFLFNFFFNALLYSDEVVSNKYHNNGKLDFIVTIVLSILSNIITSIICFYLNYTRGFDERWELITELKIKKYFIKNVRVFFKFLKIKYVGFFILEIALIGLCYYYIVIFFIIYSRSKGSLTINYLTSLIEGLITSIAISIIILLTRKIGLACLNKHIYNASKYINNKF